VSDAVVYEQFDRADGDGNGAGNGGNGGANAGGQGAGGQGAGSQGAGDASSPDPTGSGRAADLRRLSEVPVQLSVEIGRTGMTVGETLDLRSGSIVTLDRLAGEPVDLLVNGTPIARGEVVVVDEQFGLRVSEIIEGEAGTSSEGTTNLGEEPQDSLQAPDAQDGAQGAQA
jgi:flagellar motor switch protein FliN/FliY